jgi:molybdopterin-guanine dinucleotide biosynthesis protein A
LVPDIIPGYGALGGLYTALKAASHPFVAVVACDMPFVNPNILSRGRKILEKAQADAVIPYTDRGYEPLHAVHLRESCLPAVAAAIEAEKRRMISWHTNMRIYKLTPEETREDDPRGLAYWNVNTPEEFHQAEEIAKQLSI